MLYNNIIRIILLTGSTVRIYVSVKSFGNMSYSSVMYSYMHVYHGLIESHSIAWYHSFFDVSMFSSEDLDCICSTLCAYIVILVKIEEIIYCLP